MEINIIKAWKDPFYRASLSPEELASLPENPIGEAMNAAEMKRINGGSAEEVEASQGWFCSISGECPVKGEPSRCCNPFSSGTVTEKCQPL